MKPYAYRAVDANGLTVRRALDADDPEQALARACAADKQLVMLYVLENDRYRPLFDQPNHALPPVLSTYRHARLGLFPKQDVARAIRQGLLQGKCGWFVHVVETRSLVDRLMACLQQTILESGLREPLGAGQAAPWAPDAEAQQALQQVLADLGIDDEPLLEDWEGCAEGLPALPIELPLEHACRLSDLLENANSPRFDAEAQGPSVRLARLLIVEARKAGASGLRLTPASDGSQLEHLFEHEARPGEAFSSGLMLHNEVCSNLAAAAGIDPTGLPPASARVTLKLDGRAINVTAQSGLQLWGETLSLRWDG